MNVEAQPSVEHRGTHNVDIHVLFRQLILLMNLAHSKSGLRKIFSFLFFSLVSTGTCGRCGGGEKYRII